MFEKTLGIELGQTYGALLMIVFSTILTGQTLKTLNPQPSTLNPQPSTLNPQPSTLNPQPSTLNPKP
jgi:hypothetical protein